MDKQLTYNYSSTEITSRCRVIIDLVKRDINQFNKFGITEEDLDKMANDIKTFEEFPEDKLFATKVSDKTRIKDANETLLKTDIRNVLLHISVVMQGKDDMKKYFKSQKVTGIPVGELIEFAEKVLKVANQFKAKLNNAGLRQEDFDNFKARIKNLRNALKELEVVRIERVKTTDKRRELGKNLYEQLVKYSTIGKTIWKTKDPERYKSYLLYDEYYQKIKQKRDEILKDCDLDD